MGHDKECVGEKWADNNQERFIKRNWISDMMGCYYGNKITENGRKRTCRTHKKYNTPANFGSKAWREHSFRNSDVDLKSVLEQILRRRTV